MLCGKLEEDGAVVDSVIYLAIVLGLAASCWLSIKTVGALRRVSFLHFTRTLGSLVTNVAAASWKLLAGGRPDRSSSSRTEPLDFSGTGGRYNARTGNYDNGQDPFGIYPNDDHRF